MLCGISVNPREIPATRSETASSWEYFGNQLNTGTYLVTEQFDLLSLVVRSFREMELLLDTGIVSRLIVHEDN